MPLMYNYGENFILSNDKTTGGTAIASDLLSGKTAYSTSGYITGTIPLKNAETYIPTTIDRIIGSGIYLSGNQTIKGDEYLIPENIKAGVSIFGVNGTYEALLIRNDLFKNDSTALTDYGSQIYFKTVGIQDYPTINDATSLSDMVLTYNGICSSETNWELRISSNTFGLGSTVKLVFTKPIYVTDETIFIDTANIGEGMSTITRLVQATGSGTELAENIFTNSQVSGSYVDISGYRANTNGNYITTAFYNTSSIPDGWYYVYLEIPSNNFYPKFREIFQYVTQIQ